MGSFKKDIYGHFARVAKSLSSGNRLEMLEFLAQCEYSVEDLAKVMELSVANTSHHLQQLRQAGLVTTRKEAQRVFYRTDGEDVIELLGCLRRVADRHLAEVNELVDTYLTSKDSMEPIDRDELIRGVKEGSITVIDVRPPAEFAAGHLPGALNIPIAEVKKSLAQLDKQSEVVAYCRGPYCVLAFEAVDILRRQGYRARRLQDGYPEWVSAGLPVTRAS